jgi:hypothetical protein
MFVMEEAQRSSFRSDQGFNFQLARRVRALAGHLHAGEKWNHKTGKVMKVHRNPSPKAMVILADHLKSAFGVFGLRVAKLEAQRMIDQDIAFRHVATALEALR